MLAESIDLNEEVSVVAGLLAEFVVLLEGALLLLLDLLGDLLAHLGDLLADHLEELHGGIERVLLDIVEGDLLRGWAGGEGTYGAVLLLVDGELVLIKSKEVLEGLRVLELLVKLWGGVTGGGRTVMVLTKV